jgi:hypothetical protein
MIVPGGGLSKDGARWIACRKGFFLPVRALSKLFRRLMLEKLAAAHASGKLNFFRRHAHLAEAQAFRRFLRPCSRRKWFVYAKRHFAGATAVLAYLSRYTHRVAISNRRLVTADATSVSFRVKDYRAAPDRRWRTMTLDAEEFIRRILIHVLPKGLHRIRHYGLFASAMKSENLARMPELLDVATPEPDEVAADLDEAVTTESTLHQPCPRCGHQMRIIETFAAGCQPRHPPQPEGIDSS